MHLTERSTSQTEARRQMFKPDKVERVYKRQPIAKFRGGKIRGAPILRAFLSITEVV